MIIKKKIRKPRTKAQKQYWIKCPYYDGDGMTECLVPWIIRSNFDCKGNIHVCNKEGYRWLASLSDDKRCKMMSKGW